MYRSTAARIGEKIRRVSNGRGLCLLFLKDLACLPLQSSPARQATGIHWVRAEAKFIEGVGVREGYGIATWRISIQSAVRMRTQFRARELPKQTCTKYGPDWQVWVAARVCSPLESHVTMMRSPSDAGYRARRGSRCGRPWGQRLVVLRKAGLFWALWMPPDGQSPRDVDLASARINYWAGYGSVLV